MGYSVSTAAGPYCCGAKKLNSVGLRVPSAWGSRTAVGTPPGRVARAQVIERGDEGAALVFGQIASRKRGFAAEGLPAGFTQYHRPDAADRLAERLGDRQVFAAGIRDDGGRTDGEEIRLVRLRRQRIGQTGQQLADFACPQNRPA